MRMLHDSCEYPPTPPPTCPPPPTSLPAPTPPSLCESCMIHGTSPWQTFHFVTCQSQLPIQQPLQSDPSRELRLRTFGMRVRGEFDRDDHTRGFQIQQDSIMVVAEARPRPSPPKPKVPSVSSEGSGRASEAEATASADAALSDSGMSSMPEEEEAQPEEQPVPDQRRLPPPWTDPLQKYTLQNIVEDETARFLSWRLAGKRDPRIPWQQKPLFRHTDPFIEKQNQRFWAQNHGVFVVPYPHLDLVDERNLRKMRSLPSNEDVNLLRNSRSGVGLMKLGLFQRDSVLGEALEDWPLTPVLYPCKDGRRWREGPTRWRRLWTTRERQKIGRQDKTRMSVRGKRADFWTRYGVGPRDGGVDREEVEPRHEPVLLEGSHAMEALSSEEERTKRRGKNRTGRRVSFEDLRATPRAGSFPHTTPASSVSKKSNRKKAKAGGEHPTALASPQRTVTQPAVTQPSATQPSGVPPLLFYHPPSREHREQRASRRKKRRGALDSEKLISAGTVQDFHDLPAATDIHLITIPKRNAKLEKVINECEGDLLQIEKDLPKMLSYVWRYKYAPATGMHVEEDWSSHLLSKIRADKEGRVLAGGPIQQLFRQLKEAKFARWADIEKSLPPTMRQQNWNGFLKGYAKREHAEGKRKFGGIGIFLDSAESGIHSSCGEVCAERMTSPLWIVPQVVRFCPPS